MVFQPGTTHRLCRAVQYTHQTWFGTGTSRLIRIMTRHSTMPCTDTQSEVLTRRCSECRTMAGQGLRSHHGWRRDRPPGHPPCSPRCTPSGHGRAAHMSDLWTKSQGWFCVARLFPVWPADCVWPGSTRWSSFPFSSLLSSSARVREASLYLVVCVAKYPGGNSWQWVLYGSAKAVGYEYSYWQSGIL